MHKYRKKTIILLSCFLILFGVISIFAYIQLKRGVGLFGLNMPYYVEDLFLIVTSIAIMLKIIYEIVEIEHAKEYEKRINKD